MQQITRNNHYVPQWYQRGFLPKGRHKLHVLDLQPASKSLPSGLNRSVSEIDEIGTKSAFVEADLYTTRFGTTLNDEIERFLFGKIDASGAAAVRGWINGDPIKIQRRFQDFFEYMDAQKLRTPKGLDWISRRFQTLPQTELMMQMQALRQMHCTMWSECVREIVSATKSTAKFLVSDHPVTVYHPKLSPNADECRYPSDPSVELVGTQTIFALDANHCLILTNLEYAQNPVEADLLARRTNARFRGDSIARTDAFVRGRELNEEEVHAVNRVLKSRAKRYVAAGDPAWLYPEKHCALSWESIGKVFLPQEHLWRFGGEIYIGYKDGTSAYRDSFGRTSKAHAFLSKSLLKDEPSPEAPCGCGGGLSFRDCCANVSPRLRPSWRVMGIRERNLVHIRAIKSILQLNDESTTWQDVRRNLSNDQVRRIHEVYAALWPADTRLIDLLPSPQNTRSRALFLGATDARTLSSRAIGMLAYVDELVIVNPFVNANAVRPDFSPVNHPAGFRAQTLLNVFVLMMLEPYIRVGRVHLVPDPIDYDLGFRDEIKAISKRFDNNVELGPMDKAAVQAFSQDERMRAIKRLPPIELKAYIKRRIPAGSEEFADADIDSIVRQWKKEVEADPLSLLDPLSSHNESGEYTVIRSFARETGLYVATLTGSFVYTDSDTQWARLHETDGVHSYEPDPARGEAVRYLEAAAIKVPNLTDIDVFEPSSASVVRRLLRDVAIGLRTGAMTSQVGAEPTAKVASLSTERGLVTYKLRASIPVNGFQRIDVSRLVLMFGRTEDVAPVRLGLLLEQPHTSQ
jgi:Protein of unknown function (DUF4238)